MYDNGGRKNIGLRATIAEHKKLMEQQRAIMRMKHRVRNAGQDRSILFLNAESASKARFNANDPFYKELHDIEAKFYLNLKRSDKCV